MQDHTPSYERSVPSPDVLALTHRAPSTDDPLQPHTLYAYSIDFRVDDYDGSYSLIQQHNATYATLNAFNPEWLTLNGQNCTPLEPNPKWDASSVTANFGELWGGR